jgi:hypothetical protein
VLITENGSELVVPIVTEPKSRLAGLTVNSAGPSTTIKLFCVLVLVPTGPLTINRTSFVPAAEYVCVRLTAVVLLVPPSPKLHDRVATAPVEVSVNVTVNGAGPLVGVAVKLATGTIAPVPVTVLVELPPLAVVKVTVLVNPPALDGANRTTTFVEPPAGMLKELPEMALNGPPVAVATPLLTAVPPLLLTVNTRCELVPVAIVPKSIATGLTTI